MNPQTLPLRDIHLPDPIGWWPPAPGWWVVAALLILVFGVVVWLWRQRRHRQIPMNLTLRELNRIEREYAGNKVLLAQELSVLLRRSAMTLYGREATAGLTGVAWLAFLDTHVGKPLFNTDNGRFLLESAYNPKADVDTLALVNSIRLWISTPKPQRR